MVIGHIDGELRVVDIQPIILVPGEAPVETVFGGVGFERIELIFNLRIDIFVLALGFAALGLNHPDCPILFHNDVVCIEQPLSLKYPDKYRFLSTSSTFDFFDVDNPFCDVSYRAVRFKLDGLEEYESIVTNLPREVFSPAKIKELYHMRWSEEISFRHLKYSADLSAVHARKRSSILQEIWARAILYNFRFIIIRELTKRKSNKRTRKYVYVINKTRAIHLIHDLLMKRKGGSPPPDLEALISKETFPLRPAATTLAKFAPSL